LEPALLALTVEFVMVDMVRIESIIANAPPESPATLPFAVIPSMVAAMMPKK